MTLYVEAVNASRDGLLLKTASPHLVGKPFRVSFTDPESREEVVATVEAVWCHRSSTREKPHMGLRIVDFERGSSRYNEFVARHYDDYLQAHAQSFIEPVA